MSNIQEKIQKINQLNDRLELVCKRIKYSEEQIGQIDDPNLIQNKDYSPYYAAGGELKIWAKPQHIRYALTHAIEDLKADAREIERQLAELIK